jgi:hypothetical protein
MMRFLGLRGRTHAARTMASGESRSVRAGQGARPRRSSSAVCNEHNPGRAGLRRGAQSSGSSLPVHARTTAQATAPRPSCVPWRAGARVGRGRWRASAASCRTARAGGPVVAKRLVVGHDRVRNARLVQLWAHVRQAVDGTGGALILLGHVQPSHDRRAGRPIDKISWSDDVHAAGDVPTGSKRDRDRATRADAVRDNGLGHLDGLRLYVVDCRQHVPERVRQLVDVGVPVRAKVVLPRLHRTGRSALPASAVQQDDRRLRRRERWQCTSAKHGCPNATRPPRESSAINAGRGYELRKAD